MKLVIPWKYVKPRTIWILILVMGALTVAGNLLRMTVSYSGCRELPTSKVLRNLQQSENIGKASSDKPNTLSTFAAESNITPSPLSLTSLARPRKEVQHIAFLKVHKAASSTVQNILLRFGWNRNLTFLIGPAKNPSTFANIISLRESLTNSNILPPPPGKHYDILCNHVLYTNEAFSKFMPKDSVFIGIVREPFEHFKSILNYMRLYYIFLNIKSRNPVSEFLRNPSRYEPKQLVDSWTKGRMSIEFGFPAKAFITYNQTIVDEYLKKLDKEFKIMLITENMEESVIIMRRYLGWQTKDILFISQNKGPKKNETMLPKAFERDLYKGYAKLDYALYSYFYKRLREQIRHEGADFDDELLSFSELRKQVHEYCFQNKVITPMEVQKTRWGDAFNVTKQTCNDMRRIEIDFITRIRVRQYGRDDV